MNNKLKLIRISLVSFFVFNTVLLSFSQAGKAPVIIDSAHAKDYYLEMRGAIKRYVGAADLTEEKLPTLDGVTITVVENGKVFQTVESDSKGKCTFRLPLERYFKIVISKKGYVSKFFEVSTRVPKVNLGAFTFNFDVDIFEEIKKLDVSPLKKPIAKVTFDPIYIRFQYDDSYTSRINFELKKMYKNYYEIEQAQKDSIRRFNSGEKEPQKEEVKKEEPKKGGNQKATNTKGGGATPKEKAPPKK